MWKGLDTVGCSGKSRTMEIVKSCRGWGGDREEQENLGGSENLLNDTLVVDTCYTLVKTHREHNTKTEPQYKLQILSGDDALVQVPCVTHAPCWCDVETKEAVRCRGAADAWGSRHFPLDFVVDLRLF